MDSHFLFKFHFSLALYMTGIIWLVQMIHYPLFKLVNEDKFCDYHKYHIQKTSVVIAIPMILEMLSGLYLIASDNSYRNNFIFLSAYILLVFIWFITFFVSVPRHNVLAKGFNELAVNTLISTNWGRTVAWTLRAIILFNLLS